jgi:hypothetical protein
MTPTTIKVPGKVQDVQHPYASTIGRHGKIIMKTLEKYLRKGISIHQRDWEKKLPLFLLDYKAINPRKHRHNFYKHGIWKRATFDL